MSLTISSLNLLKPCTRLRQYLVLLAIFGGGASAQVCPQGGPFVVAFAQDHIANDWRAAQVKDLQQSLAQCPTIRFEFSDAQGNTAKQIMAMEDFAARKVDVLITSPRDAKAMTPVISAIYRQGIAVILLSRGIESKDYTTFIRGSNYNIGQQAAQFLAQKLTGKGRILVLQHIPTSTPAIERTQGFEEALKNYPGVTIVATKQADSLRSLAIQRTEEALAEGIPFDAIYAQSDSMAAGARLALEKAGIDPASIPTVGIDYIQEAQQAILAGKQAASFTYPTFGREGAQAAIRLLCKESVPQEQIVPSQLITLDNAEKVKPIF